MRKTITKLILISAFLVPLLSFGQDISVSGKVTDEEKEPLPGVNVIIQGTDNGTVTDIDGNFKIDAPSDASLLFSFIGYKSQTISVGSQTTINVSMVSDIQSLSEVVVTAFGVKQEKKALGYAVEQLEAEELMESKQVNVINALQGRVAGVNINSSSGQPGGGSNIIIRGITSLNPGANNQPLIVVDGIVISNATDVVDILPSSGSNAANSAEQGSSTNRLADINPDDIESMNVLKGPAASALYGSRAANGVIVITTKSGKSGKTVVSLSTTQGWDELGIRPEIQTKYREGRFGRLRFRSNGNPLRFQTLGPKVRDGIPVYDNIENFFVKGSRQEYNLSVSGGTDKARIFTSVSNLNQKGITPFSSWKRTTVRLKGDISLSDKLTFSASANYTRSGGNKSISGDKSIMSSLSYMTTTFDINDYLHPDGSMKDYSDGIIDNPRYLAEFVEYNDVVNRVSGQIGLNYQITDWLTADYRLGTDYYNDTRNRFVPPGIDLSSQNGGFIVDANINRTEINSNFLLTATKSINEDFNASLTLGNQIIDISRASTTRRGESFTFPDFNDIDNTANLFGSDHKSQYRQVGFFADAKLDYRGIVYLNFTARNDISSSLPKNSRSYFYPGVNLGFIFSEYIPANSILTYGKFRASWAQVGKDAAPHSIGFTYEGATAFPFNGINGFRKSTIAGDLNLRPEITTSIEFGTDLRFLNNKIGLDLTYYKATSTDMILNVPISNGTGLSRYTTNAGEIENSGFEIMLNATPVEVGDFTWNIDLNWSKNTGKVISVKEGIDEIPLYANTSGITYKLVPGDDIGTLYGYVYDRTTDGRLILDANGYPDRARDDDGAFVVEKVGNALPDFISGMNNRFSYKGITLSALIEWRSGGNALDMGIRNGIRNGVLKDSDRRYEKVIFDGVKEDGVDGEGNPIYVENDIEVDIRDGSSFYRWSGRYNRIAENILEETSWLRLRTVALSYNFPIDLISKIKMTGASITFTANNLFVNTPFKGYDPESNYFGSGSNIMGFTGMTVPGTKSFLFTLNVKF